MLIRTVLSLEYFLGGGVENITRIYPGTVNWDFGIESLG